MNYMMSKAYINHIPLFYKLEIDKIIHIFDNNLHGYQLDSAALMSVYFYVTYVVEWFFTQQICINLPQKDNFNILKSMEQY